MPDLSISPQLLDDLIERRLPIAPAMGEVTALARLAYDCGELAVAGPDVAAAARMRARFSATVDGGRRRGLMVLLAGGAGARPLQQKLAAAALAITVVGGATSYTTGVTPLEAVEGVVSFVRSVVVNLMPTGGGDAGGIPTAEPSPLPSATPTPGGVPSPTAQGTSGPVETPPVDSPAQSPAGAAPVLPTEPEGTPESGQIGDPATPEPTQTPTPTATATATAETPPPAEEEEHPPPGASTVEHTATPVPTASPTPSPSATPNGGDDPDDEPDDDEDDHRLGSGKDRGDEEDDH